MKVVYWRNVRDDDEERVVLLSMVLTTHQTDIWSS